MMYVLKMESFNDKGRLCLFGRVFGYLDHWREGVRVGSKF